MKKKYIQKDQSPREGKLISGTTDPTKSHQKSQATEISNEASCSGEQKQQPVDNKHVEVAAQNTIELTDPIDESLSNQELITSSSQSTNAIAPQPTDETEQPNNTLDATLDALERETLERTDDRNEPQRTSCSSLLESTKIEGPLEHKSSITTPDNPDYMNHRAYDQGRLTTEASSDDPEEHTIVKALDDVGVDNSSSKETTFSEVTPANQRPFVDKHLPPLTDIEPANVWDNKDNLLEHGTIHNRWQPSTNWLTNASVGLAVAVMLVAIGLPIYRFTTRPLLPIAGLSANSLESKEQSAAKEGPEQSVNETLVVQLEEAILELNKPQAESANIEHTKTHTKPLQIAEAKEIKSSQEDTKTTVQASQEKIQSEPQQAKAVESAPVAIVKAVESAPVAIAMATSESQKNIRVTSLTPKKKSALISKQARPGWYVQVAAKPAGLEAATIAERIAKSGFSVALEDTKVKQQAFTRILVGPMATQPKALSLREKLKSIPGVEAQAFIKEIR